MHAGFKRAGLLTRVRFANELEEKYLSSSIRNQADIFSAAVSLVSGGIENVSLDAEAERRMRISGLYAGMPCTGASRSGATKNKLEHAEAHIDAGAMFYYTLRGIETFNPAFVVLENVPEYQRTASMSVIRNVLAAWGYCIDERVFNGCEYGALEDRDRLVVLGKRL